MSEPITVEQAQARGLHLVLMDDTLRLHVGDVITHTASGRDLRIVEIVNDGQAALAKLLRFRRSPSPVPTRRPVADRGRAH